MISLANTLSIDFIKNCFVDKSPFINPFCRFLIVLSIFTWNALRGILVFIVVKDHCSDEDFKTLTILPETNKFIYQSHLTQKFLSNLIFFFFSLSKSTPNYLNSYINLVSHQVNLKCSLKNLQPC